MNQPERVAEVFLHQGEVCFGGQDTRIRTILGSCVAITMWHPQLLLGGMCHYMLPGRHGRALHCRLDDTPIAHPSRRQASTPLDGKYADEALELMFAEIKRNGTHPREYQIKLFGGGDMFPSASSGGKATVGTKNVEAGTRLLSQHGLKAGIEHLGGVGHRNLIFEIWNGHVWMKHQATTKPMETSGAGNTPKFA